MVGGYLFIYFWIYFLVFTSSPKHPLSPIHPLLLHSFFLDIDGYPLETKLHWGQVPPLPARLNEAIWQEEWVPKIRQCHQRCPLLLLLGGGGRLFNTKRTPLNKMASSSTAISYWYSFRESYGPMWSHPLYIELLVDPTLCRHFVDFHGCNVYECDGHSMLRRHLSDS